VNTYLQSRALVSLVIDIIFTGKRATYRTLCVPLYNATAVSPFGKETGIGLME
jgi:hypothetical protein